MYNKNHKWMVLSIGTNLIEHFNIQIVPKKQEYI